MVCNFIHFLKVVVGAQHKRIFLLSLVFSHLGLTNIFEAFGLSGSFFPHPQVVPQLECMK